MEYRFTANLKSFTGEDITIEDNCFKRIYKIVMSEARAAGCNLSGFKYVAILDRHTLTNTVIGNFNGYIAVANSGRSKVVHQPKEVRLWK